MLEKPVGHTFTFENEIPLAPSQRIHLILLGVADISKSLAFYESLGWKKSPTGHEGLVKFDLGGYAICLLSRKDFAKDTQAVTSEGSGFPGVGFVYLAKTADEVPRVLARAVEAGGVLVKAATRTPWGVAGYFKDPDGHLFEVDFEESWVFDSNHRLLVDEIK